MTRNDYILGKNKKAVLAFRPQIQDYIKDNLEWTILREMWTPYHAEKILDEEYRKHKQLIDHCTNGIVFCIEPHIMKELFNRYVWYKNMFCFFPSTEYFMNLIYSFDLTDVIKSPAFKPIFGNTDDQIEKNILFNCEKMDLMHNGLRVFAYQPYDEKNEDQMIKIIGLVKKLANTIHINLNTSIIFGEKIFRNDMRALEKLISGRPGIEVLKDIAKGKPVVCVAAGPSLGRQLEQLKAIQDKVFIVAVMAAYKPLAAAGIKADLYTVIDMDTIIQKYFTDIDLKGVKIAIEMACDWGVMENYPDADYIVSQSSSWGKEYLRDMLDVFQVHTTPQDKIQGAMTVAMMSVQIAYLMGASEIISIGMDLCYREPLSHIGGSDHESDVQLVKHEDKLFLGFHKYGEQENVLLPCFMEPACDGINVPTTFQFLSYRDYIEYFLKEKPFYKVINCSEQGLVFKGAETMLFSDAISKFILPNITDKTTVNIVTNRELPADIKQAGLETLRSKLERFKYLIQYCREGYELLFDFHVNLVEINKRIQYLLGSCMTELNYIAQNNLPGFFLYKYIEYSSTNLDAPKLIINNRNKARFLFKSMEGGMQLFVEEIERILGRMQ